MKISYNWLKEFIDLELSPEETAHKLTLIGLEVEEVIDYGSRLEGVVVGKVLEVKEHPNADRLLLCRVNTGKGEVQIVCGADNVAGGQKVPVATVGTVLPVKTDEGERLTVRKVTLRGEDSSGMICSEAELGLSDDHSGIMVLDESLQPGTPFSEAVDLYQDSVIDIEITPNRPDATCHVGVARDLSAALNLDLKKPYQSWYGESEPLPGISIDIESPEKCHRYTGKIVRDVTVGESPSWLKNRLKALGIRPVNNIVDVTNYVLLEMGQPLHAFDLNTLKGNRIVVKDYDEIVEFETLDHIKRKCSPGTLFICDAEEPVAIAGVMGGVDSEVSVTTENILIESAYFDPGTIRKTAKEQNLQTDASYRFERGIDPRIQRIAAERAADLIAEISGGTVSEGCTDVHPVQTRKNEITLRSSYVNRLLGTDLDISEIKDILHGLELETIKEEETTITYAVPTFRPDLTREVDLIEEVGRLHDYNKIPTPKHAKFTSPEPISDWEQLLSKSKSIAKGMQFREIYTNSLMSEADAELMGDLKQMIHTLNPISKDMTTLRSSLLYGFLQASTYNFNRKAKHVRFFEIGNVFRKSTNGTYYENIQEETCILFGLAGLKTVEHWKTDVEPYDFFDLKAPVNSFLKQLGIFKHVETDSEDNDSLIYFYKNTEIGRLQRVPQELLDYYEIEHAAFTGEFSLTKISDIRKETAEEPYRPVSKFPSFEFDFALVVDRTIKAGTLLKSIENTAGNSLKSLQVFDVFEGPSLGKDKKSIAFRLSFLDKNKTLTIRDVEPIINKVLKVLDNKYSAKLRS